MIYTQRWNVIDYIRGRMEETMTEGRRTAGDVAHFAWIHTATFADPDNPEVENYTTVETPQGFHADYQTNAEFRPSRTRQTAPAMRKLKSGRIGRGISRAHSTAISVLVPTINVSH
jgi:hypothetical protein